MNVWKDSLYTGQPLVECALCRKSKAPRGRSAPVACYYCDWDCPGYALDPQPGTLWPGELREEFGFPEDLVEKATSLRAQQEKPPPHPSGETR